MSLYSGLSMLERIDRIRRASKNLELARNAAREAETSSSKEILESARALLRAHRLNFGADHLEIVDVIGRLLAELDKAQAPAQELPAPKPPARATAPAGSSQPRRA